MRVIFMGTPTFAIPTLDALIAGGHEIVLVVAQPDKPAGRGQKPSVPPVIEHARRLGLDTAQPKALRSGPFPERFHQLEADVGVVIAYGRILPEGLLRGPKYGCVNLHASLLPRWRGAAPIQWAILSGDKETGVCAQRMEADLDTGPIYCQEPIPIDPEETTGSLHDRLATLSGEVILKTLDTLPQSSPVPQDDIGVTWAPKITKEMGCVDWSKSAAETERRVRAMTPWPGGWVRGDSGPLKLRSVRAVAGQGVPGTILSVSPHLVVACGEGALELIEVQGPGKRRVSGRDFANGARLLEGELLPWPS
jgi:methionyl-tRNA formyltransferase